MLYALAPLALAAVVAANPMPQADVSSECSATYPGTFQIQVVNQTSPTKRMAFEKRQSEALVISLNNGVLTDAQGRIGNIVANQQFQFDPAPGQPDALFVDGFAVCNNGSLSVGGDSTFYQCLSGTFYNLYDENIAEQCSPVYIQAINGGGSASQVPTAGVTQISDGQLQAPTTTGSPVSQIYDGQVQAPTTTGSPVSQISDGQLQAPTTTGSPVSQIPDGQLQAPTSTGSPVSQISDGQLQAPTGNATIPTATPTYSAPVEYTGAASHIGAGLFGLAGVVAVAML